MRRPPLAPFLLALSLAAIASSAHADCPGSTFLVGGLDPSTPIPLVAAACDTTLAPHGCDELHGRYLVNAGLLIAASYSGCPNTGGPWPAGIETVLEDDFTVTGLPAGTPISLHVVLDLRGFAESFSPPWEGGGGRLRGLVREGTSNEVSLQRSTTQAGPASVNEPLTLTIAAVAGTPFRLRFAVRGEALEGRAEMEGAFRFTGLPPGALVQSCRGYSSGAPVPARASTWGALKAR